MAYPSSTRPSRGTSRKIAATATNESWKPASKSVYGFQASSATAPSNRKCQRSTMRALSQASDASPPAIPARITDGCGPTASTYAPMLASAPSSPTRRDTPSNQLSESAPAATRATFCPETASRWYSPEARNRRRRPSDRPLSSPRTIPSSRAARSPCNPRATECPSQPRNRSDRPPMPPRLPTAVQASTRRTTWIP